MDTGDLITVSDLQRDYSGILDLVAKNKKLTLYRYRKPVAVLVSPRIFEKLVEAKRKYEEFLALQKIAGYEKDKKSGNLLMAASADELFLNGD